jgi:hypothetical protein
MTSEQQAVQQKIAAEMVPAYQALENRIAKLRAMHVTATQLVGKLNVLPISVNVEEEYPRKLDPYYRVRLEWAEALLDVRECGYVYYLDANEELELHASMSVDAIAAEINAALALHTKPS